MNPVQKKTWFWIPYKNIRKYEDIIAKTSIMCLLTDEFQGQMITTEQVNGLKKDEISGLILLAGQGINELDDISVALDYCESEGIVLAALLDPLQPISSQLIPIMNKAVLSKFVVPLDIASEKVFNYYHQDESGRKWEAYLSYIGDLVQMAGEGRVYVHLFAGCGETEEQFARTCQLLIDIGARVILLSLDPNNALGAKPCSIGRYRRMQVIRYLIDHHIASYYQMNFNQFGSVYDFGVHPRLFSNLIDQGLPFMDAGICGGISGTEYEWPGHCNDYQDMRNISHAYFATDSKKIISQLTQISWEEEWHTINKKFTIEKIDFSDLEEENDLGGVIKAGQFGLIGLETNDLRHLKNN